MDNEFFYARQIPDHLQDPDIMDDEYFSSIILSGNSQFGKSANSSLLNEAENAAEDAMTNFNDCLYEWKGGDSKRQAYEDTARLLTENYTVGNHQQWTADEVERFIDAYSRYVDSLTTRPVGESTEECLADVLTLYTGVKYATRTIVGTSQSDWQQIYYPSEQFTDESISVFETAYFNTGTEWMVHDGAELPETPEEIDGYSVYCCSDNPRKELAGTIGCKPEQLVMYEAEVVCKTVYKAAADNPEIKSAKAEKADIEML